MGWGEDHCLGVGVFFTIFGVLVAICYLVKYNKYILALIVNSVFIEML